MEYTVYAQTLQQVLWKCVGECVVDKFELRLGLHEATPHLTQAEDRLPNVERHFRVVFELREQQRKHQHRPRAPDTRATHI